MGSCYSCRSGEGSYTYTTVSMATTAENPVAGDGSTLGKRGSPYTRGGSGGGGMTTSFGFKRRIPATLKSLSQERTSEMVQKYECKIANINNSAPARSVNNGKQQASNKNRTPHSNIPRPGFRESTNSRSSSNSVEDLNTTNALLHNGDPNSNSVIATDITGVLPMATTKTAVNGTKGVDGGRGTNQSKRIRETSPDLNRITNGHKTEEVVVRHGNGRTGPPRQHNNRLTPPRTIAKVTTHVSGLPRPRVPLFTGAKNSAVTTAKENPKASEAPRRVTSASSERSAAPIAKCDEIEAMQISSDAMPEDEAEARLDSGLGGSVSDRVDKNDGDNETLAEVSELASDSTSEGRGGSKERTPERSLTVTVHSNGQRPKQVPLGGTSSRFGRGNLNNGKQDKPVANSSVARPKLSQPTSAKQVLVTNYASRASTRSNDSQHKTEPPAKSAVDNVRKSFSKKKSISSIPANTPNSKSPVAAYKNEEKTSSLSKENKPSTIPPASKAAEDVSNGILRLSLDIRKNTSTKSSLIRREKTDRSRGIDASTQSPKNSDDISVADRHDDSDSMTLTEKLSKTVSDMATSMESCASQQDSLNEHGPFSPPSERDQFLIDDEISDQPELIACQQHDMQQRDLQQRLLEQEFFDVSEDGGSEGLALLQSCSSLETLSSTSSLGSDDLMMDFENESADAPRTQRSGDQDTLDENSLNSSRRREHSKSHSRTMKLRDAKGGILDEWSNLLDTHSSANGRPRTRRARAASTPDVPCPSLLGASQSDTHLLRPPKQMTSSESEDGGVKIDPSSFRSMTQDVTNLKTMLYKLKRVLHEAETLNPFESHLLKNGLFHNLAHNDPPHNLENADRSIHPEDIQQENTDLRRQVVFLQQQLEERDKTIRLLQHQMTKHISSPVTPSPLKELCNSATQTEKPRVSLSSMSQSYEESPCGTTVSSNGVEALQDSLERCGQGLGHTSPLVVTDMTRSLGSLPNDSTKPAPTKPLLERIPPPPERSASAVELSPRSKTSPSSLLKSSRPSVRDADSARPSSAHCRSSDTVPLTASAVPSHVDPGQESSPTGSRSRIAVRVPSFRGATSSGTQRPTSSGTQRQTPSGTQRPKMGTGVKTNSPLAKATVSTFGVKR